MKKDLMFILFNFIAFKVWCQNIEPISIFFTTEIEAEYNIIGLEKVGIILINNLSAPIFVKAPAYWSFYANIENESIAFSEGQTRTFDPLSIKLESHDTLKTSAFLNFFDLNSTYTYNTGNTLNLPLGISFRLGVFCDTYKQTCYSKSYEVLLKPLDQCDETAYQYIKSNTQNPSKITSINYILGRHGDIYVAETLIKKYSESTFADLASLSLAYQKAREITLQNNESSTIPKLLEKPLKSKYSIVHFFAEELAKKQ